MTNEEAIEEISFAHCNYCMGSEDKCNNCMYGVAIAALNKQEPIGEPDKEWMDLRGYTDTFVCGECHANIRMPILMKHCEYDYCPYCGQKWTD